MVGMKEKQIDVQEQLWHDLSMFIVLSPQPMHGERTAVSGHRINLIPTIVIGEAGIAHDHYVNAQQNCDDSGEQNDVGADIRGQDAAGSF